MTADCGTESLAGTRAVRGTGGDHAPVGATARDLDADALELTSDFIDAADRVAVRFIWRGAGYGPESNIEFTGVYTGRKFWDHAEALETTGLRE